MSLTENVYLSQKRGHNNKLVALTEWSYGGVPLYCNQPMLYKYGTLVGCSFDDK